MVAIQIRDVPEELRDRLGALARERGQSLQAYLLDLVSDEVRRQDNLAALHRPTSRSRGTRLSGADVVGTLHNARRARDTELGVPAHDR